MRHRNLKFLSHFEGLTTESLDLSQRKELLQNPQLFISPLGGESIEGRHSAIVDSALGFRVPEIERGLFRKARDLTPLGNLETWGSNLHNGNQTWVGLAPETLQTPYAELAQIWNILRPPRTGKVVDLGAGYGRMALVLKQIHPDFKFEGFEFVQERVEHGNEILKSLDCDKATLIRQDLTAADFKLPEADYYFIYDYGKIPHIRATLKQLSEMADHRRFKVIARGKGVRGLIEKEHPWLSQVYAPHHEENFSIYFMSGEDNLFLNDSADL
jgi:SAM-dependent methyltransferase